MSADVFQFSVFASSSRGLMARVILPSNKVAVLSDIAAIAYSVVNKTDNTTAVTGSLSPADVMFATVQSWPKDSSGFTFLWAADGSLWPIADKRYKVVITFTIVSPYALSPLLAGKSFILVYQADTKDPQA